MAKVKYESDAVKQAREALKEAKKREAETKKAENEQKRLRELLKPRVALRFLAQYESDPNVKQVIEAFYTDELSKYKARSERARQSRNKSSKEQQ